MSNAVQALVRAYAERLRARFADRLVDVCLFGSYARGEADEESDVDVLAVVRDLAWKEKIEAIELAAELSLRAGLHISPVVMSQAEIDRLVALESAFARRVLEEGIRP